MHGSGSRLRNQDQAFCACCFMSRDYHRYSCEVDCVAAAAPRLRRGEYFGTHTGGRRSRATTSAARPTAGLQSACKFVGNSNFETDTDNLPSFAHFSKQSAFYKICHLCEVLKPSTIIVIKDRARVRLSGSLVWKSAAQKPKTARTHTRTHPSISSGFVVRPCAGKAWAKHSLGSRLRRANVEAPVRPRK